MERGVDAEYWVFLVHCSRGNGQKPPEYCVDEIDYDICMQCKYLTAEFEDEAVILTQDNA